MDCPRCGTPMEGGVCPECGFPVIRFAKVKRTVKKTSNENHNRIKEITR